MSGASTGTSSTEPCYNDDVVSLSCLKKLIAERNIQLFDVRTRREIEGTGIITGATNIPVILWSLSVNEVSNAFSLTPDEFEKKYKAPKPGIDDGNITFYCQSGMRAQTAMGTIQELGYKRYQSN
ncbi:hypothetical protein QZH41_018580, partial [Actinostola sp. cb2023]